MERRLVIALGIGPRRLERLAQRLCELPGCAVSHEARPLPWEPDLARCDALLDDVLARPEGAIVGDAGFYWLPYVEHVLARHPSARVVVLRGRRDDAVARFVEALGPVHPFVAHDGTRWERSERWDRCYPTYPPETGREEAVARFWGEYHARARALVQRFPERARQLDSDAVDAALAWLDAPAPRPRPEPGRGLARALATAAARRFRPGGR
ncbi:MAG: hypothetical protein H6745_04495 [Deltaproteobacteria bacterium]|nr:hypothetical protein [Deltaproteobacteria bacterium]